MNACSFLGRKVLVIGLGISGRSAARFLLAHQACVYGADRDIHQLEHLPDIQELQKSGLTVQSDTYLQDIQTYDFIVLSPGVPLYHPLVQSAKKFQIPVIGEIDLGCRACSNPLLGVTGTNGKTTVTLLIAHVLNHCGKRARALGNVGVPFTQELLSISQQDIIVLELSSYQIETLYQCSLSRAVLLNITPDHLDRYKTMQAYAEAKCKIEHCIKSQGQLYVEEKAWSEFGHYLKAKPRLYGYQNTSFIYTDLHDVFRDGSHAFELPISLKYRQSHDLENALAAYALCADEGISGESFVDAWKSFQKPAHRVEFVLEHHGVKYLDDSKGTNIDAVIRAVQSIDGFIILIAGGVDKGASYVPWIKEFKNKVKSICAIGQAADKIKQQLSSHIHVMIFDSLEHAVLEASQQAQRGDYILLSPGCSSFDMFKDYAHRGEEFQRIVKSLRRGEN